MEFKSLLKLNIYSDDTFTKVREEVKVDKIKIPYRVAMYVISSLDNLENGTETELLKFVTQNTELIEKIVKATFGISETDLEYVDGAELVQLVKDLYAWASEKMASMKRPESKNLAATV